MGASAGSDAGGAGMPGKRKCMVGSSALPCLIFLAVALAGMAAPSEAEVYMVGDSAKWTILGSPNYTAWAASKTFRVGDTIVFEYNKDYHNVMEVNKADYTSCNVASPKGTYSTGNDSFVLKKAGHYYYLCGVPTHCTIGQKVDVNVLKAAKAPAPAAVAPTAAPGSSPAAPGAPNASPGSSSSASQGASPPEKSHAAAGGSGNHVMGCAVALLAVAISTLLCP